MPQYELSLIFRSLPKADLAGLLKKSIGSLLDSGAVVTKCENLGHRDLPYKMKKKGEETQEYSGNFFVLGLYTKRDAMPGFTEQLNREPMLLRSYYTKIPEDAEEIQCTLGDDLKPATERPSVQELRLKQRMSRYEKGRAWKRAQFQYRLIPKSFTVGPRLK